MQEIRNTTKRVNHRFLNLIVIEHQPMVYEFCFRSEKTKNNLIEEYSHSNVQGIDTIDSLHNTRLDAEMGFSYEEATI